MDRQRLTRLLKDPERVAKEDLGALRHMVEQDPWFSGGHLLLAQGESSTADVLVGGTLQNAAAHVPDREVLYRHMHLPPPSGTVQDEAYAQVPSSIVPAAPVEPPPTLEEPLTTAVPVAEGPRVEPVMEVEEAVFATPAPSASEERSVPEIPDPALAILEQQMLEAAMASGFVVEQNIPPALPQEARPAPRTPVGTEPPPPPPEEPVVLAPPEGPGTVTRPMPPHARLRFTEWLTAAGPVDASQPPAVPDAHGTREQEKAVPGPTSLSVQEQAPVDASTLIDRFIREQTPEPRARQAFFTPQEAAKRSLEEPEDLVTETLARIYAVQGNKEKARKAYRALALKYPDKSSYFAALEKELEG